MHKSLECGVSLQPGELLVRQHARMWRIFEAPKKLIQRFYCRLLMSLLMEPQKLISIHWLDIDVCILSLRRYPQLCHETNFITGTGQRHWVIKLQSIVHSLGTHKIAALPALHALSGVENTGSFAGKGKATWWKAFQEQAKTSSLLLLISEQVNHSQQKLWPQSRSWFASCMCRTRLLLLSKICDGGFSKSSRLSPRNFHQHKLS